MAPVAMLIGLTGALLRSSLGLAQSLLVTGPAECPAPAVVDARVREILGLRADTGLPERASVERVEGSLRITLRGADTHVLGERLLPADGSCDEQAAAVAVLLAAWLSDVHPEFVGELPEAPPQSALATPEVASQGETPVAPATPAATPAPAPTPERAQPAADANASGAERAELRWDVSVAAGGVLSSASPAPFGALGLRYFPGQTGWGAALGATFTTARRVDLSSGIVRYFRFPLVLGPAWRARAGSLLFDASVGAAAAWLHVGGVGFQGAASHDSAVFGGAATVRLALPQGRLAPFLELSGMAFQPGEAFVHRGTEEPSVSLPNLELYAGFGGAFRAW